MRFLVSVDDGSLYDSYVAEILDRYDIPGIFYIPGVHQLTPYELSEISARFTVGGHTQTHALLTRVDERRGRWEIQANKRNLEDAIGKPLVTFAYPRGYYREETKQWVKDAGFDEARTVRLFSIERPPDPYETHPTIQVYPYKREYGGVDWWQKGQELFSKAKKLPNGRFEVFCHGYEIERHNQWENFEAFLKWAHERLAE